MVSPLDFACGRDATGHVWETKRQRWCRLPVPLSVIDGMRLFGALLTLRFDLPIAFAAATRAAHLDPPFALQIEEIALLTNRRESISAAC